MSVLIWCWNEGLPEILAKIVAEEIQLLRELWLCPGWISFHLSQKQLNGLYAFEAKFWRLLRHSGQRGHFLFFFDFRGTTHPCVYFFCGGTVENMKPIVAFVENMSSFFQQQGDKCKCLLIPMFVVCDQHMTNENHDHKDMLREVEKWERTRTLDDVFSEPGQKNFRILSVSYKTDNGGKMVPKSWGDDFPVGEGWPQFDRSHFRPCSERIQDPRTLVRSIFSNLRTVEIPQKTSNGKTVIRRLQLQRLSVKNSGQNQNESKAIEILRRSKPDIKVRIPGPNSVNNCSVHLTWFKSSWVTHILLAVVFCFAAWNLNCRDYYYYYYY